MSWRRTLLTLSVALLTRACAFWSIVPFRRSLRFVTNATVPDAESVGDLLPPPPPPLDGFAGAAPCWSFCPSLRMRVFRRSLSRL